MENNNFKEIMDQDSSEEEIFSGDSDYLSDASNDYLSIIVDKKSMFNAEVYALNRRTKQCVIYSFYYTSECPERDQCAECMLSQPDINSQAVREHVINMYDFIRGKYCAHYRNPMFLIFPCNMCPTCTQ